MFGIELDNGKDIIMNLVTSEVALAVETAIVDQIGRRIAGKVDLSHALGRIVAIEIVLDAGAEEVNDNGDSWEIVSEATDFVSVRKAVQEAGVDYDSAEASWVPNLQVPLDLEGAKKMIRVIEALEDSDDVQDVFANGDIPDEVLAALDCAQATEFVSELPNGVESSIAQGGSNVSGGQKQRLAIARALVKKAPVYIFDDSFSALDFKTDAKLRRALTKYTENAVVLIVAQRVSTIMNAEQIIVLDEGKIVGKGTHKELLKTCPEYREIAESQLSKEELA